METLFVGVAELALFGRGLVVEIGVADACAVVRGLDAVEGGLTLVTVCGVVFL